MQSERKDLDEDGTLWISPKTDEIVFRKYKTFSVNEKDLEVSKRIKLRLHWLNVVVSADSSSIRAYNLKTQQGNGQVKFHYLIKNWKYEEGDPAWLERISEHFKWKLV